MTAPSLSAVILRYKAEMFSHYARQIEAEERGEACEQQLTYWPVIETIEDWNRPAASLLEAIEALNLAIEDYGIGDTPRIPAMMRAALGWMKAEAKRRSPA